MYEIDVKVLWKEGIYDFKLKKIVNLKIKLSNIRFNIPATCTKYKFCT